MSTSTPIASESNPVKSSLCDALGFLGLISVSGLLSHMDFLPQTICMAGALLGMIGMTVSVVMAIAAHVQKS